MRLLARGPADPLSLAPAIRAAIESVDPDLPMYETFSVRDAALRDKLVLDVLTRLFGIFGLGAILLTAIGLYSVTAFVVTQRTREFGIRMALGATSGDVLRLVRPAQGARQVGLGLAAGLLLAVLLVRAFSVAVEAVAPADAPDSRRRLRQSGRNRDAGAAGAGAACGTSGSGARTAAVVRICVFRK